MTSCRESGHRHFDPERIDAIFVNNSRVRNRKRSVIILVLVEVHTISIRSRQNQLVSLTTSRGEVDIAHIIGCGNINRNTRTSKGRVHIRPLGMIRITYRSVAINILECNIS